MSDTVASLNAKYGSGRIQYFAAGCNSPKSQQMTVDAIARP